MLWEHSLLLMQGLIDFQTVTRFVSCPHIIVDVQAGTGKNKFKLIYSTTIPRRDTNFRPTLAKHLQLYYFFACSG